MYRPALRLALLLFISAPLTVSLFAVEDPWTPETFEGLKLRGIGPALMSGRIADIAIDPRDRSVWYVAVGSGGLWKTENAGTTWKPIFDDQPSYSIGCVVLDPEHPDIVWVGTGENVSGRHVGYGDGLYRSRNGGESWERVGLDDSEHIGRILIDPRDTDVIYVAAEGPLWNSGGDRGVYKSEDGGSSWERVLHISDDTGATDLEFDPRNPDILYAAVYQRRRSVPLFLGGGPESGIFKSVDAGETWRRLEKGLPSGDMGKIGLAVSPVDPDYVYATIEATDEEKGFYRSLDMGESWEQRNSYISGATGPHYYQEIYASPHERDLVYQMDVRIRITRDGGKTFELLGEPHKHSDNHALVFDPGDPLYLLAGTDGGLYETWDHGGSWKFIGNLPVTQFYKLDLDNDTPFYNVVGGTQDNNSQLGPSRTLNVHGIRNQDWIITLGGDGHGSQIDPENPNIVYSEWQVGNLVRFDKATGERVDIKPQPAPDEPPERWNWDAPILISPHSHTRLYFGSQRLWRSDDRGDSWTPVSGDLTRNQNRYELEVAGRVWSVDSVFDHFAMSWYNTTTSISESPLVEGLIYVGTDDGLIQVTEDGGENWRRVESLPGVPEGYYVNEVKASVHDPDGVFVALDDHKSGDYTPYLLQSSDRGRTWRSISGDLPDRHLVWSVEQDHEVAELVFAGTEFGIFFTRDGGNRWVKLRGGVPTISFRDIEIQRRESDLVGATFGRGFYVFDDYSPLRTVGDQVLQKELHLFPVKDTLLYVPKTPLGGGEKASQGAAYFTAPNPPFGAIFTYCLAEGLETDKGGRRSREKELREAGEDVPFPGWERLEQERLEEKPLLLFTISDSEGNVIRRVTGPASKGFHRIAWDLRYPSFEPVELEDEGGSSSFFQPTMGPLVLPGRYTVSVSRIVDGEEVETGESGEFEVEALGGSSLPTQGPREILTFQQQTWDLMRRALSVREILESYGERLSYSRRAVLQTPDASGGLLEGVRTLRGELDDLQELMGGDKDRADLAEPTSPGVIDRLRQIVRGHWLSTYGPTQTHRRNYDYAESGYAEAARRVEELRAGLRDMEQRLENSGAPWTPGRGLPPR